jgi:hypothetical protein
MRMYLSALAALALVAACNPEADTDNAAIATEENIAERSADAPSPGASSFTEAQARGRLQEHGYSEPITLTQAEDGSWRGTAMQNGRSVQVTVDYQGLITPGSGAAGTPSTLAPTP